MMDENISYIIDQTVVCIERPQYFSERPRALHCGRQDGGGVVLYNSFEAKRFLLYLIVFTRGTENARNSVSNRNHNSNDHPRLIVSNNLHLPKNCKK